MASKGYWWFKLELNVFNSQGVLALAEKCGPEGIAAYFAMLVELHSTIDGTGQTPFLTRAQIARRIGNDINCSAEDAARLCDEMADLGLLDPDMWRNDGKASAEQVVEQYQKYTASVEAGKRGAEARWGKGKTEDEPRE